MDLSLRDMFVSETVGTGVPVKIIREWANNHVHPRDSNDGLVMMKVCFDILVFVSVVCGGGG